MRSVKLRSTGLVTLLALAGAGAALASKGAGKMSVLTGSGGATSLSATGTPAALTASGPVPALTCPGEVIWRPTPRGRPTPRARTPRVRRTPPPPPPIPRGPIGIEGRVTDATSGQLLNDAAVTVVGTGLGTLTNPVGYYSLTNVPAGEHTVRVVIIGYATQERQVTVSAGQATVADFALEVAAINLDEIVATGVAGRVERREARISGVRELELRGSIGGGRQLRVRRDFNTESYARIVENDFRLASASPLSTFSIDVDRASYANVRRFIQEGTRPPSDAVRIEEMINYFPYQWADVAGEHPFAVTTEVTQAPWKREHRLVRIGLHAPSIETRHLPPSNLVFLLDVSGSMDEPNKLPLLQSAFALLADRLRSQDRVTVLTYSSEVCLALPSTSGDRKSVVQ